MADFPTYPASTFEQAVDLTIFSGNQLHDVVNGDALTEVETENGTIPSVRKALVDNIYFKDPIPWETGGQETSFNQLRLFIDTTDSTKTAWYYAPSATASNPVPMGASPIDDFNWKIFGDSISDVTRKYAEEAKSSAEQAQNAETGAEIARDQARDYAQSAVTLSKIYPSVEAAQSDIDAGLIPLDVYFFVRSLADESIAAEYQNKNSIATATGREIPSTQAVLQATEIASAYENDDLVFTFSDMDGDVGIMGYFNDDGEIEVKTNQIKLGTNSFENNSIAVTNHDNGFLYSVVDVDGNLLFGVDNDGNFLAKNLGTSTSIEDIATLLNTEIEAMVRGDSAPQLLFYKTADEKLNVIVIYGQSNALGADSLYAISTDPVLGNLMLGQSPRGSNFSSGTTNYTYGPVGGTNTLYPLKEVVQATTWGESIITSTVNTLKILHNREMYVKNDEDHLFAGGSAGVSGATIEKLSPAANQSWGRFTSMLDGFKEAADAQNYTIGSCSIFYIQGEADANKTYDYYYNALTNLKDAMNDAVKTAFGQDTDTYLALTQYGGQFVIDTAMNSNAIMDFCDNNPDVVFAGCHHQYPGFGAHGFSNTNRWIGGMVAKALHSIMRDRKQPTFKLVKAKHKGNEIYVSAKVPVPPITFRTSYDKYTPVLYSDYGFTVKDGSGTLVGESLNVEVVQPNVIKITCERQLTGTVTVVLGDQANHHGVHNVSDSDKSMSPYSWTFVPDSTMSPLENIEDLNGKRYPLYNWCGRYTLTSEEF